MKSLPKSLEARHDLVDIRKGRHALFLGLLLDLHAVLVTARKKKDVIARKPFETRDGIGNRRAVSVTDMELRARVVDRRRYVE